MVVLKIAFLSSVFGIPYGGAEVATELLMKALRQAGHNVCIITTRTPVLPIDGLIKLDYLTYFPIKAFVPGTRFTDCIVSYFLHKKLEEVKPDIIHITDAFILPAAIKANVRLNIPLLVTCHQSTYVEPPTSWCERGINYLFRRRNKAYLRCMNKVDSIITVSDYVKRDLLLAGVEKNKVNTIPNIVGQFYEQESVPVLSKNNITLLASGRIVTQKGFEVTIKALKYIIKNPSIRLIIAGDGPELSKLKQLAKSIEVDSFIDYTGWVSRQQMQQLYRDCDIVLISSIYPEAYSMVGAEAMCFGKPVVASNIGAIPELIINEETGLLFSPGNDVELANAVNKLISDSDLRSRMGQAGQRRLADHYNTQTIVDRTVDLYVHISDSEMA